MSNEMINEAGVIPNTVGEITVIFEDTQSREEAVRICDQLMARFWSNHPLDVEWWSFADLEDPRRFREASVRSARSDVLIFAVRPESELPAGVRHWIESWVTQRRDREGAFIAPEDASANEKFRYLRTVAHRAGMDYLTLIPPNLSRSIPDSLDSYSQRADHVSSVLDEILRKPAAPPLPPVI